ncbi:MAG: restriction endonuclease, partial [Acidovorax sp.]|nr:restriction endonuclease [Acidovorax sp.]
MVLDPEIRARWAFLETSSAAAVLRAVCPEEWAEITGFLRTFQLVPHRWLRAGGNRGDLAQQIDSMFNDLGWREIRVDLTTQGI